MDQPYDVFRKEPDGRFVWCGAAKSLVEAHYKIRIDDIRVEHLIINENTSERTVVKPEPLLSKSATNL